MTQIREGKATMSLFHVFITEEKKIPEKFFFQDSHMDGSQYFRFVYSVWIFSLIAQ